MKSSISGLAAVLILISACDDDDNNKKPGDPANTAPVVVTNGDQTVSEGVTVTLDGASSYDADDDITSYAWTQTAGPDLTLGGASTAVATFTAPDVSDTTVFRFSLKLTDATGLSASATVVITVIDLNAAPVVDAGVDQNTDALMAVTLTGSATDDGTVASYAWTQVSGPDAGDITDADQATATLTAPDVDQVRNLIFELAATDNEGKVGTDTVIVTVNPVVDSIAFIQQPSSPPQRNAVWSPVTVNVLNAGGERIIGGDAASLEITLTAALEDTSDVTGDLNGTLSANATSGTATFADLSFPYVTEDANAVVLTASATGVTAVDSQPIAITWPSTLPGLLTSSGTIVPSVAKILGGNLLLAGTFTGTVDFDFAGAATAETTRTATNTDAFIAFYDSVGDLTWVEAITSSLDVGLAGVAVAGDTMLVAVNYGGGATVTFPHDTTPVDVPASGGADVAFATISTDGITTWAGAIAGGGDEIAHAVAIDLTGNLVIAGEFSGVNTDFDPDASATAESSTGGDSDGFVLKLDPAGAYVWHAPVAGAGGPGDAVTALGFQDSSQDVMATGYFGNDGFLVRLARDDAEERVNVTVGGSSGSDVVDIRFLEEGANNTIYLVGEFEGTVDFDPDEVETAELTAVSPEVFVLRLNMAGVYSWARRVRSDQAINVVGISVGSEVLLAGTVSGEVDFDPDGAGAMFDLGGLDMPYIAGFTTGSGAYTRSEIWTGNPVDITASAFSVVGTRMLLAGILGTPATIDLDPNDSTVEVTLSSGDAAWAVKLNSDFRVVP